MVNSLLHDALQPTDCTVIGIGNMDRGDDAVGLLIARHLREDESVETRVLEHSGEASQLISTLRNSAAAFIADAADFGAAPGSVYSFDARLESVPAQLTTHSTHGFGLAQAIELARALGSLPHTCRVYAVQAESFDIGATVSPAVAAAVPIVAAQMKLALSIYRAGGSSDSAPVPLR